LLVLISVIMLPPVSRIMYVSFYYPAASVYQEHSLSKVLKWVLYLILILHPPPPPILFTLFFATNSVPVSAKSNEKSKRLRVV
jgi:hypothetical protein